MKNVTLSADEDLLERARLRSAKEKRTLNTAFREWLERYAGSTIESGEFDSFMKQFKNVRSGRRFTRDERNER